MIQITAPGDHDELKIGLRWLDTSDTVDTVTATSSDSDLTVANEAATTGSITVNGRTYATGEGITFDLSVGTLAGVTQRDAFVYFDITTTGGERRQEKIAVRILDYDTVNS